MTAFAVATDTLFADENIATGAIYTDASGTPVPVRVVLRQPDDISSFGDARLWSETMRLDLRAAEVANPRPGDRIVIDADAYLIQGEPARDAERLIWTVDLRPSDPAVV
jgi:hypothetical protein